MLFSLVVAAAALWKHIQNAAPAVVTVVREQTVDVRGQTRQYRLVLPKPFKNTPAPVLFVFHGSGETPEQMAHNTGLDCLAAEHGVVVVYPQGRRLSWPTIAAERNPRYLDTDLECFDAILDDLAASQPIDMRRVYVVGMSQGGTFVCWLAANRGGKVAAAASHSGWLPESLAGRDIHNARKSPVMFLVGTEDKAVPPDRARRAYEFFQQQGHEVAWCELAGVGHHWAAAEGVDRRIWQFLSSHSLP